MKKHKLFGYRVKLRHALSYLNRNSTGSIGPCVANEKMDHELNHIHFLEDGRTIRGWDCLQKGKITDWNFESIKDIKEYGYT